MDQQEMDQQERLNMMGKVVAYRIKQALDAFSNEPEHIQKQARRIIMERVNRMLAGENLTVEGHGLVTKVEEDK